MATTSLPQPAEARGSRDHSWLPLPNRFTGRHLLIVLGDTHDRGPTVSCCHGLSTRSKAGAHDLNDASSTHPPPETTPITHPPSRESVTRSHPRGIGSSVPGRRGDQGVASIGLSHGSPGGLLCYLPHGPFRWVTLLLMHLLWLPMAQASTSLDMVFS